MEPRPVRREQREARAARASQKVLGPGWQALAWVLLPALLRRPVLAQ